MINPELDKVVRKKQENYKNKIDALHQILVLKPFYKKFCIIRRDEANLINSDPTNETSIKIDNTYNLKTK